MLLRIESKELGDRKILTVDGVLDYSTVEHFQNQLKNLGGYKQLNIDFCKLRFIDSTGIHSFAQIIKECKNKEINLKVSNIPKPVFEILDVLGLIQVFGSEIFDHD